MFLGLFHRYSVISTPRTPSGDPLLKYSTSVSCTLDIALLIMGVDINSIYCRVMWGRIETLLLQCFLFF